MTSESKLLLKQTVFRLLEYNQKDDDIFNELVSYNLSYGDKESHQEKSEISSVPVITSSDVKGQSFGVEDCLKRLICVCKSQLGQRFTPGQKEEINTLMNILKAHYHRGHLKFSSFVETLSTECQGHLEIWMFLHKHGIVPLQHYIERNQRDSDFIAAITQQILEYEGYAEAECLISGVLCELISLGFSSPDARDRPKECSNTSIAILDNLVKDCLCEILKNESTSNTVIDNLCCTYVPLLIQKPFYSHLLAVTLGYRPEMKVSKAVREQIKWVYPKISNSLVTLYKQVLLVLDIREILNVTRQILEQHEVNWQLLLSFIAVLTVCIQESQKYIIDFTDSLLQEGLEDCDLETTITGLLVARQACLQGPHVFMSYADWFQRTFSDNSRSFANSRKSFTFLMKLLTDLAPYESPQNLKVHILRPPYVPGKCRQILTDYIMLAKTRLQDLQYKPKVSPLPDDKIMDCSNLKHVADDISNLCPGLRSGKPQTIKNSKESVDPSSGDNTETNKTTDNFSEEVSNAVESFNTLGKIPTSIIEASIFRKPYYIGQFLPALLKARPLPDLPDAKMKLITALKKADKIPQSLYENYDKLCRKEAMQLMEGVFEDLDSDDDMELPPLEQLDNSLQHLQSVVNTVRTLADKPKHTVSEVVSVIASKVEACLSDCPVNQIDPSAVDMSQHSVLTENCVQVVDLILNRICEVMQSLYESGNFNFTWLTKLMEALIPYRNFTETLYKRVTLLLVKQGSSLQVYHIEGLAAMLVEIHMVKVHKPSLIPCSCAVRSGSILEFIVHHMSIRNKHMMELTLRFIVSCLKYVYSSHLDENMLGDVPCLLKKFSYLTLRLVPECRNVYTCLEPSDSCTDIRDVVVLLKQSRFVDKLSEKYLVTLQDWLDYETQVDVESDIFTSFERYRYHQYIVYHHFKRPTERNDTYGEGASIMFKCLLNLYKRDSKINMHTCLYQVNTKGKGAETEIVHLLSNLTLLFTATDHHTDSLPWLLQQVYDALKDMDSEITAQSIVLNFTRLAMSLPTLLLFCNVPRNITSRCCQLKDALNFINEICVTHISEGVLFPVSFIVYIAQGLLQASNQDHYDGVIEFVTENCPAISISFVVHVRAVTPFLDQLVQGRCEFAKFYNKLRCKNFSASEKSWLSACHLFSQILSSKNSDDIETVLHQSKVVDSPVIFQVTEMLFHQLTYLTQFATGRDCGQIACIQSALKSILQHNDSPDVLDTVLCCKSDPKTQKCVKSHLIKLYPVTVLRFLRDASKNIGPWLTGNSFNGLLTTYTHMCQLYEEEKNNTKVVETDEITQTCTYMVTVIQNTPREILKSTNQDILMECGPRICDAVLQQI